MGALLLVFGLLLILYNLILNLTNLSKIISYCFETNSLDDYWDLLFEACFHKRAIYSSIIIFIIGAIIFIVILPFILIKGIFEENKMEKRQSSGAYFKYPNLELTDKKFDFSNIQELGIDKFEPTATGNIKMDFLLTMGYIEQNCKSKDLKINQNFFETYDLANKMRVVIPITIEIGDKTYPLYLIYSQEHKELYRKINPVLKENHFENALYLSLIPM